MRFTGFIGPSYTLRSVDVDCQRCVNLYPELDELGSGKDREVASLVGTPGRSIFCTLPAGPIRAKFTAGNGQVFAVGYNKVYKISSLGVATEIGTLSTFAGRVSIADSGQRLAIVDGTTFGFFWTFATSTFSAIPFPTDIDFVPFAGCDQVTFQDGYFIYNNHGTGQFFISGLVGSTVADDSTIDPLDFGSADGSPDGILSHVSSHQNLWFFGSKSIEVFYNSGDANFPFTRVSGAFIEYGLAAAWSVAKMNNTLYWLGGDDKGAGIVFQAQGYQPQRISTHAVEFAIQGYGDISDATSYCYQEDGHHFFVLNFPSASKTWVYDTSTSLWHERAYLNNGNLERDRAECHAFAFGKHLVGDYANGNIYEQSSSIYTDNGSPILRLRASPHISDSMDRIMFSSFQLDMEAGVGLDGSAQGIDPKAMLQFSDDGGHSWSNEQWRSIGKIGNTKARTIWRRLGTARNRVFRVMISDPNKVVVIGAEIGLMKGAS